VIAGALVLDGFTDVVAVASGGDSTIYRAHQSSLDRDVAIKVVSLSEPEELRRFEREISLTVRLGRAHPNIVTVLDTRILPDGRPCIVMDFFELGSIHDRLRVAGPFASDEVVTIGRVIADALAFAHDQRVVHRDVKPQNILMLPTSYVLADFGIARSVDAGHTASLERLSYRHASPEVLDGRPPEPTDDLWSLTSTMATLLEGRAPFAADDPGEDSALAYLRRVRLGERRPLPADTPPALAALIDRGMHPDRRRRFGSAAELMAQLRELDRQTTSWAPQETGSGSALPGVDRAVQDGSATAPRHAAIAATVPESKAAGVAAPGSDLPADSEDRLWAPGPRASAPEAAAPEAVAPEAVAPEAVAPEAVAPESTTPGRTAPETPAPGDPAPADLAAPVRSGAAATTPVGPAPASGAARPEDAEPTGWRPETATPAGRAGDGVPPGQAAPRPPAGPGADRDRIPPKVRGRIIVLAAVMLVAAAVLTYFLVRTPPPPAAGPDTSTQVTGTIAGLGAAGGSGTAATAVSSRRLSTSDPDYTPQFLKMSVDGNLLIVTVRGPQADDAALALFDATDYDRTANTGNLVPLTKDPVARAKEGDTQISVPLPAGRKTIVVAVMGLSPDSNKSGIAFSPPQKIG
jgi:hypothetical protein